MDPADVATLAARQRRLSEPSWPAGETPRWLESRPEENGRSVLVEYVSGHGTRILSPAGVSVRSRLHAYGGGSYTGDGHGGLFLIEDREQELLHLPARGGMRVHRPPSPGALGGPVWDDVRRRLLLVHETDGGDRLLAFRPDEERWEVLHDGPGFLMQPRIDPWGRRLAWIAWDEDVMPWERTRLVVAEIDASGRVCTEVTVRGGDAAYLEPLFDQGGSLFVLADGSGRWRLERVTNESARACVETDGEIGRPAWNAAVRHYGVVNQETLLLVEIRATVARVLRAGPDRRPRPLALPFTEVSDLATGPDGALVLAGAHETPLGVFALDPSGRRPPRALASSLPEGLPARARLPEPRSWSLPLQGGGDLHGWLYERSPEGKPRSAPLVLRCHGGPTTAATALFDPRLLLWTTLGAAVLDLNYRGSSGFGRAARLALAGAWGRRDPVDVLRAWTHLVRDGKIDHGRIALAGSSAGGYTVLRTLERRPAAGAVLGYPVTDLTSLADEGVRFEKPYAAHLLAREASRRRRLARLRSPRPQGGLLTTPLLVFQGDADPVVPPSTTQAFVERLRRAGARIDLCLLPGEGHGFRRAESLVRTYTLEAAFLSRVFDLPPPARGR